MIFKAEGLSLLHRGLRNIFSADNTRSRRTVGTDSGMNPGGPIDMYQLCIVPCETCFLMGYTMYMSQCVPQCIQTGSIPRLCTNEFTPKL